MYRQSPSRNQRSRGFKVKHVLQICLLLAVCFWLIYQVKHSHDKRKEYGESDGRSLLQRESPLIKLGRKDAQSRLEGAISKKEKHEEPEEEEEEEEATGEEVEENKSEEDELEYRKVKGKEDEATGNEEDEIDDEHEQEKSHEEVDRDEDMVDEEKEREEVVENETQETDSEDVHGRLDKEISAEEGDHDGDDGSVDEAREEHYKADDASSAVTHEAQIGTNENENENEDMGNSKENPHGILEGENKEDNGEGETSDGKKTNDLLEGGGEVGRDDHQSNMTSNELDSGSSTNNTEAEGVDAHLTNISTPEITTEGHDLRSESVIESKPDQLDSSTEILMNGLSAQGSDLNNNASNPVDISVLNADSSHVDSNSTGSFDPKDGELHSEEFSSNNNNINNTESSAASEKIIRSVASVEAGNNGSLPEKNDEIKAINDGADKILESATESHVDDLRDAIDISDTSNFEEETDVHTDLHTIPEIQSGGTNSEDVAAE